MKVLVVDDHVLIRQAMQGVLRKLRRDAVMLDASTGSEALRIAAEQSDVGLVLLDLTLPDQDGFSVLADLRKQDPRLPIVVLSAVQDATTVRKALDLGALGFIPKSAEAEVMLSALRLILAGGIYIPPTILSEPAAQSKDDRLGRTRPSGHSGLTGRQLDVLALMMQGKSNKAICRILNLAEPTVKIHVTAILRSLRAANRTEAVIAASQLGLKVPEITKS